MSHQSKTRGVTLRFGHYVTAAIYLTIYAATGDFMRTIAVGSLIAALILIAWETADLLAADLRRITHTEPLEVSQ